MLGYSFDNQNNNNILNTLIHDIFEWHQSTSFIFLFVCLFIYMSTMILRGFFPSCGLDSWIQTEKL